MSVAGSDATGSEPAWRRAQAAPFSSAGARGAGSASRPDLAPLMKRRNRLSRSRDFDSVYRHGQSVSSRYLVLYAFPRPGDDATGEPRLGLAAARHVGSAAERNRIKRRLRAAFTAVQADLRPDCDYVLIVKPGLVEAAESRGFPWLLECVRDVLGQAAGGPAVPA